MLTNTRFKNIKIYLSDCLKFSEGIYDNEEF